MRSLAALALLLVGTFAAAPPPAVADGGGAFEKRWKIVLHRPNLSPPDLPGILVLEKRKQGWTGTLVFASLAKGERQECVYLKVDGPRIEWKLAVLGYAFKGELKGDGMAGTCETTQGHLYDWDAAPDKVVPAELFEPGLVTRGGLPPGDARSARLDLPALYDFVRAAEAADTDALVIVKDGKVVCERTFGKEGGMFPLQGVTEFVTAFAVACLLEEGKVKDLDAPLSTWLTGWKEGAKGGVTVRHLLTHTSGLAPGKDGEDLAAEKDPVAYASSLEVVMPGSAWARSDAEVALVSGVISRAAGKPCDLYLRGKLFDPMGIKEWKWDRDETGHTLTWDRLRMTARDLALLGQLVADRGLSQGAGKSPAKQLVNDRILGLFGDEATPRRKSQGLLWTRVLHGSEVLGVRAEGRLGQHLVVYPKEALVGVRLRRGSPEKGDAPEFRMADFPAMLRACLRP